MKQPIERSTINQSNFVILFHCFNVWIQRIVDGLQPNFVVIWWFSVDSNVQTIQIKKRSIERSTKSQSNFVILFHCCFDMRKVSLFLNDFSLFDVSTIWNWSIEWIFWLIFDEIEGKNGRNVFFNVWIESIAVDFRTQVAANGRILMDFWGFAVENQERFAALWRIFTFHYLENKISSMITDFFCLILKDF